MLREIKGTLSFVLYCINLVVHAIIILCVAPIVLLIPIQRWRIAAQRDFLQRIPDIYTSINQWITSISTRDKWDISGVGELKKRGWYLMVSNHQSWIDIPVLYNVFNGKIPPQKFFLKKQLLWQLPLAGLACYALGYPFMSRHSRSAVRKNPSLKGQDIEETKKSCQRLRHFPMTLINFAEGTRCTPAKMERQQSPFQHLLKPHAGGVAVVVNELQKDLSGIINVVICYPKKIPSVWEFCSGNFDKIVVRYDVLPITPDLIGDYHNDRHFRTHMQQWFNMLWERNDALINQIKRHYEEN